MLRAFCRFPRIAKVSRVRGANRSRQVRTVQLCTCRCFSEGRWTLPCSATGAWSVASSNTRRTRQDLGFKATELPLGQA